MIRAVKGKAATPQRMFGMKREAMEENNDQAGSQIWCSCRSNRERHSFRLRSQGDAGF